MLDYGWNCPRETSPKDKMQRVNIDRAIGAKAFKKRKKKDKIANVSRKRNR